MNTTINRYFLAILISTLAIPAWSIDAITFRGLFIKNAKEAGIPDQSVESLIYLPAQKTKIPDLVTLDLGYSKMKASMLYANAIGKGELAPDLDAHIRTSRHAEDKPLIVIVPGIFGEFIDTRAFEEVFAKNLESSYYAKWADANMQLYRNPNDPVTRSLFYDTGYDTHSNSRIRRRMFDLISVSSVTDMFGTPEANVILFNTPRLSLESLGDIEQQATLFTRRLEKFFAIMGTPKRVVLMGYSRGTMIALSMLAQAQRANKSWLSNVKGMVSLGGVTYGSALADEAVRTGSKAQLQLSALRALGAALQELPEGIVAQNRQRLFNGGVYAKFAKLLFDSDPKAYKSASVLKGTDPQAFAQTALAIASKNFELTALSDYTDREEYNKNIRRFKALINEILIAVPQLTTSERLNWWRTNTLPTSLKYYSLCATMSEPEEHLLEVGLGFNLNMADDKLLVTNWSDYKNASKISLNDSQIAVQRCQFSNDVIQSVNPSQKPLDITDLALLGTHHWGLALQIVNKMKDGQVNRFPREVLLRTLAESILVDNP